MIGSKIIQNLHRVPGGQITFTGYSGEWMKREGFDPADDLDVDEMADKTFHTNRKTKATTERAYYKWNPLDLLKKHCVGLTDDAYENLMRIELPRHIYQSRPSLIVQRKGRPAGRRRWIDAPNRKSQSSLVWLRVARRARQSSKIFWILQLAP